MANYTVGHITFRGVVTWLFFLMFLFTISPVRGQVPFQVTTTIDLRTIYKDVTYGINEKLVYSNTQGRVAAQVPQSQLVADDLVLNVQAGCQLRRYTFEVTGKANPFGAGGAYTVQYALYDFCPGAGGQVIPGTDGSLTIPAEQDAAITTVEMIVPVGEVVLLPFSVWIGLKFDRGNCGIVMGAPALVGFSDDIVDFPGFACNANLGGFPTVGHASYNVELFSDVTCEDGFVAYRNVNAARAGFTSGIDVVIADDLELNVASCEMTGYEIGIREVGTYQFEMRNDLKGLPGAVIQGTQQNFINDSGGTFGMASFQYETPIPIPSKVWMTFKVNNGFGGWVLTRKDASVGRTRESYVRLNEGGTWDILLHPFGFYGGFYTVIHCLGEPPVGACCDMFITDENDDSVCRDVPEMNCPYPERDSSLRPQWREGVSCQDNDPFFVPCGVSACCKPRGSTGDPCENLTRNECIAVEPIDELRVWEMGQFCGSQGQECPVVDCFGGQGDCFSGDHKFCEGGPLDGKVCEVDRDCQGYCDIDNMTCIGGNRDGLICTEDSNCPDGNCRGFCKGGLVVGYRCRGDIDCEIDFASSFCEFTGGPTGFCNGGERDGRECFGDRDCKETTCECSPSCEDPSCCSKVCEQYDPFCCEECWDETCALEALRLCFNDCNQNGISDEEDIAIGTSPDVNSNGIPDECEDGACCLSDSSCLFISEDRCVSENWTVGVRCVTNLCPPPNAACCNSSPGLGGVCMDGFLSIDCQGSYLTWFNNTSCTDIVCEEVTGSCCDSTLGLGGKCTDDVLSADCQGNRQSWTAYNACAEIVCEEVRGACCDSSVGSVGLCTENVLSADCQGEFETWSVETSCVEVICEEVTGACCDSSSGMGGLCADDVLSADCQGNHQTWSMNTTCSALVCEEVTGACCDRLDGFCRNGVLRDDCVGSHSVWTEGVLCGDILCDPAMGACCNTRFGTCTTNILADCAGTNLSWTKGEECGALNCPDPFIPTVSQWGMLIMTLLLMIGAKLFFGRREVLRGY